MSRRPYGTSWTAQRYSARHSRTVAVLTRPDGTSIIRETGDPQQLALLMAAGYRILSVFKNGRRQRHDRQTFGR